MWTCSGKPNPALARDTRTPPTMTFKIFANKAKDIALQHAATWVANRFHLNKIGKVTALQINSTTEEIAVTLELEGETTPVDLKVNYRIVNPTLIEITHVEASRPWMTKLVNDVVPPEDKQFTVPAIVTKALSNLAR